jgi:hypothetical protein
MSYFCKNLVVITAVVAVSIIGIIAWPAQTFSAPTTVEVNLTVDEDSQDSGSDDDSSSSQTSQTAALMIDIASVDAGQDYVDITWETTVRSQTTVRWSRADGVGQSYRQVSDKAGRTHTTRITGLQSGTRYEIGLRAEAVTGDTETRREIVQTELPDGPESPADFEASLTADRNVQLSWQNPQAGRFDYVRVTRSDTFFTNEPLRGNLVYEGIGQEVMDTEVAGGDTYFYSIYSRNDAGQWSAPALAAVYVPDESGAPTKDTVTDIVSDQPAAPEETKQKIADLSFADLIFSQNESVIKNDDGTVALFAGRPFSVGLAYDKLPEVLKTVLVTMTAPDDPQQSFSFVLRADESKDFYKSMIGGLEEIGTYDVAVTVMDYKYRRAKTLTGQVSVQPTDETDRSAVGETTIGQLDELGNQSDGFGNFLLMIVVLIMLGIGIIAAETRIARP